MTKAEGKRKKRLGSTVFGAIVLIIFVIWLLHPSSAHSQSSPTIASSVSQFTKVNKEYSSNLATLTDTVDQLKSGSIQTPTAISDLKSLNDQELNTYTDAVGMKVSKELSADQESIELAISYLKSSTDHFEKYLQTTKMQELSQATDDMSKSRQGYQIEVLQVAKAKATQ